MSRVIGRNGWSKIPQSGVRRRAELLYQQLDGLQALRREVRGEFLAESRKHKGSETAAPDSLHRSDWSRPLDRADANSTPVPQQAARRRPLRPLTRVRVENRRFRRSHLLGGQHALSRPLAFFHFSYSI